MQNSTRTKQPRQGDSRLYSQDLCVSIKLLLQIMPLLEREQPLTTLPSWTTTVGIIERMTDNNHRKSSFVKRHREILHNFYDAWFDIKAGKGGEKLDRLKWKYYEKESPDYNPRLVHQLNPYFNIIRARFPGAELGD